MKLSDSISGWIKERLVPAGAEGVVVGMSGGIDSAVVAVLAKKALGENVLGLILPCGGSIEDEKDALLVAEQFSIKTYRIDLEKTYEELLEKLHEGNRIAMANLKPRFRMVTLYYYANMLNYLVAGTGNKSELIMGYFTKYGDGGADILPLGDLLKSQVRALAAELCMPEKIINRIPSAGLWEGQTDEGEMGITYDELDRIITAMEGQKPQGISKEKYDKVMRIMRVSGHKRETPYIYKVKT